MPPAARFAILLDGAFVLKKLEHALRRFPTAGDVVQLCERIMTDSRLSGLSLLRTYYYDARPATEKLINPVDNSTLDLSRTEIHARHESLLDALELKPDFALRLGETGTHEWKIGNRATQSILKEHRPIQARDLVPNVSQKGVDLRIGLDIARISLTGTASTIVVVTGDSDLIPAFKFARREGIRVYLDAMKHGVKRDLKAHCDQLVDVACPELSKPRRRGKAAKGQQTAGESLLSQPD